MNNQKKISQKQHANAIDEKHNELLRYFQEVETTKIPELENEISVLKTTIKTLNETEIEKYLDLPGANKLVGIRDGAQGRTDTQWLSSDQVVKNVSQLVQEGLTFDLLVDPPHLAASAKLVKQCPDTTFILDHIGKPNISKGDDGELKEWSNLIQNLAANQNVFCKVSGMVTEANWKSWENQNFKRYFDVILNSFGTERIMYGSDWPVCKLAASYDQVAQLAEFLVVELSATEKEKFWSLNALKTYGI
jgi:L-fuconolactonase